MKKTTCIGFLGLILSCLIGMPAAACEPIPQFMLVTQSSQIWSVIAVRSGFALLLIVLLKGLLFFYKSDLPFFRAMALMFLANIVSTVPGLLGLFASAGGAATLIAGPAALALLYIFPARSLKRHPKLQHISVSAVVISMVVLTMVSTLMFTGAADYSSENIGAYFAVKIFFTLTGVATGLLVSIGYEEACIHFFERKRKPDGNFIDAVAWANVYAMLIFMAIGAGIALPKRLASPDFLITAKQVVSQLLAFIQAGMQ